MRKPIDNLLGIPSGITARVAYRHKDAALRDWLKWMVQPIEVLNKKYKGLVRGPLDDLVDEIFRDIAPQLVKAVGEQEIDEDVEEYLAGAQEGRFEALRGWFADAEPNQSDDYYAGYDWGFANAKDWDGKDLPSAVKRKVVQEQIKEFRGEVSEQMMIAAMESAWSSVNPREIFKTVMRAVKQHGWKVGLIYAVGEIIENVVLPAALSIITGTPIPPGSFAWLPLNDIVFAAVVKRLGRNNAVDDYEEDGYLDWYEGQFGAVRLASVDRVVQRHAFVSNPVIALKNYLTQEDWEKGVEVAQDNEGHFMQWLEENPDLVEDVPALQEVMEDGYLDDPWSIPPAVWGEYFGEVDHALSGQSWSPSWIHMAYEKVMKNQWMIHFTDDAYGVACDGFKYGMDDLTRLGLTTHYNEAAKPGGYNFAYDLNDWERFARGRWGFKYGKEAVLFKASGIKVHHYGDAEYQVIFVGTTAKDIVPLTEDGYYGGWWANGIGKGGREEQDSEQGDGSFDSLAEAVDWVVANFNQYKKFLTC